MTQRLLVEAMPEFDARERHGRRIPAPAEHVHAVLDDLRLADLPVAATLLRLRGGPREWRHGLGETGGLRVLDSIAPKPLAADPPRELLLGDIARYAARTPVRPQRRPADLAEFGAFEEPGWTKVVMHFSFTDTGGETVVCTETRVRSTDERTRRTFAWYWLLVRAGSALIRREILAALDGKSRTTGAT